MSQPISIRDWESNLEDWHQARYQTREIDLRKTVEKLHEEIGELMAELLSGNPARISEEATDVIFVLMHIARERGEGLAGPMAKKLAVIWDRLDPAQLTPEAGGE